MDFQFSLSASRAKNFRDTFETLKDIPIPQALLRISQDGIKLQAMDSTHISVAKLCFSKSYFTHLQVTGEVVIGIDLIILTKLLKAMQPKDGLICEHKGDKLMIHIDSPTRTQYFYMNLIDIAEDSLDIPNFEKDYTLEICAKYFQKMIQSISLVEGNNCRLAFRKNQMTISSNGDLGTTELTFTESTNHQDSKLESPYCNIIKSKDSEEELSNNYSIEFLKHFCRASSLTKNPMRLEFKHDFPLGIVYELPQQSRLEFFIAPKCDE